MQLAINCFSPGEHHIIRHKMPQLPESGISILSKKMYTDFIVAEENFKMLIIVSLQCRKITNTHLIFFLDFYIFLMII